MAESLDRAEVMGYRVGALSVNDGNIRAVFLKGHVMVRFAQCASILVLLCVANASAGQWELVWSDEFNVAGLADPNKWDYEEGYIRNKELQYYTKARPENARVEDGCLVIETRKDNFEEHPITSASLHTRYKASW